ESECSFPWRAHAMPEIRGCRGRHGKETEGPRRQPTNRHKTRQPPREENATHFLRSVRAASLARTFHLRTNFLPSPGRQRSACQSARLRRVSRGLRENCRDLERTGAFASIRQVVLILG